MVSDTPSTPRRPRRFLKWLLVIFAIVVVPPVTWFVVQVAVYYGNIKSGTQKNIREMHLEASISKTIANTSVTREDLARLPPTGLAPELGSRDARVTVVAFLDYQCPFSKKSADPIRRVMLAMGDRVRMFIRDFPIPELHPTAVESALAANCVLEQSQDAYWRFYELLFAEQDMQSSEDLRAKAELAGARVRDYDACVSKGRYRDKIKDDVTVGRNAGVQGTPTFFVNGMKFEGALDEKRLTAILTAFLDRLPK
ncbi:hypothetical protein A3D73_01480 [Candidatus Uhrbacteria bacterium RIFCSPHIGHO2_02_FULL_60_44]|nr:MAG: hypothetical protein A3D73_01480 [Candidatus Uhrbacteria bacterium RIFCSPHIGHO2_02_FULL_60_44]